MARVEETTDAVLIPAATLCAWMERHAFWREYVFALLARRLALAMAVVDEVAFRRVDARLADYLLRHADSASVVQATHQAIADELGTSREVISRILQDFAANGWVEIRRGAIVLRDRTALSHHSGLV
ncbi:MAG: Crp/Fnr family transcriptional regulator [Thermoflexales bacterium]